MKKIARIIAIIFLSIFGTYQASAQYYYYNDDYFDTPLLFEMGGSVNAMNCLTDIGGHKGLGTDWFKDLNIGKTHLAGGFYAALLYRYAWGLRLEGTYGNISANDNVLVGIQDIAKERYNRNTNFRSTITEIAAIAEFHLLHIFIDWPSRDDSPPRYSPYLLGGIGYFSFNPQAKLNNRFIDLQPLSTEGQGFKEYPNRPVYKLKQINYPVGAGVKYELSPLVNLRLEFVYRILNTDYLDDVSTRYIDPNLFANYFTGSKLTNALLLNDR
ncbi:MAG: hypothetical protein ABIT96_00925, partial [Ferruginibacter sp.]